MPVNVESLFAPLRIRGAVFPNRIVMAPMGRLFNDPEGIPHEDYIEYFRKRAEGGTGVLVTEGQMVPHAVAGYAPFLGAMYGDGALSVWQRCVEAAHAAGSKIISQLWHGGLYRKPQEYLEPRDPVPVNPHLRPVGPSGWYMPDVPPDGKPVPGIKVTDAMSERDIEDCIFAFGEAAANAQLVGFDGVDIHGAHGYLIDQFLWSRTNERNDPWGGSLANRVRFAVEVTKEIRRRVGASYPIFFRWSQWKQADYRERLVVNPSELAEFLTPLAEAGVDVFDCSTRRIGEPAFEGSPLTLAAWSKKVTGKLAMAVGSVGLHQQSCEDRGGSHPATERSLQQLMEMYDQGWFDLVAVGRMLIADPQWANKIRRGDYCAIIPYSTAALTSLA